MKTKKRNQPLCFGYTNVHYLQKQKREGVLETTQPNHPTIITSLSSFAFVLCYIFVTTFLTTFKFSFLSSTHSYEHSLNVCTPFQVNSYILFCIDLSHYPHIFLSLGICPCTRPSHFTCICYSTWPYYHFKEGQ